MPGNEKQTIEFILDNKDKINLNHIGPIRSIKIPYKNQKVEVTKENIKIFQSDDSSKKADIYLNNKGISLKQEGGNFAFNRLQRKDLLNFFYKILKLNNSEKIIDKIDRKILDFHNNKEGKRNFSPLEVMTKKQFNTILKYLLLEGSPAKKSLFPAEYILVSKKTISSLSDLKIYNYDDYLNENKLTHDFARRRSWYGQLSNTEHNRAKGLMKSKDNKKWCFDSVSGMPKAQIIENKKKYWRDEILEKDRKTCYYLMIETKKNEI